MAKKTLRIKIHLRCPECGRQNYTTSRHREMKGKLTLKKYCRHCRRHTAHVEVKKLK